MIVFGTRPEAIKMAPLIKLLKNYNEKYKIYICVSGQHREMLHQVLDLFQIETDFDLNIMKNGQDLYDVTSRILIGMRDVFEEVKPDLVLVHGDTTTSMAASLAAFYMQISVGHVEAGLRTNNLYNPWPEEANRQIISRIATFHFSPTKQSKKNLIDENIDKNKIIVTGNTVIDALYLVLDKMDNDSVLVQKLILDIYSKGYDVNRLNSGRRMVLITGHRRENFGDGFLSICNAVKTLAEKFSDVDFIFPMHLNPNVRNPIKQIFGSMEYHNLFFVEPLEYFSFVYLMNKAYLILTDSGGIQEEAPSLGKPVLVMRETTERPEALIAGTVKLVGTNYDIIVNDVSELLTNNEVYNSMSKAINPYGDGKACQRIIEFLDSHLIN